MCEHFYFSRSRDFQTGFNLIYRISALVPTNFIKEIIGRRIETCKILLYLLYIWDRASDFNETAFTCYTRGEKFGKHPSVILWSIGKARFRLVLVEELQVYEHDQPIDELANAFKQASNDKSILEESNYYSSESNPPLHVTIIVTFTRVTFTFWLFHVNTATQMFFL